MKAPLTVDRGAPWIVLDADGHRVADFFCFSDEDENAENAKLFVNAFNESHWPDHCSGNCGSTAGFCKEHNGAPSYKCGACAHHAKAKEPKSYEESMMEFC